MKILKRGLGIFKKIHEIYKTIQREIFTFHFSSGL